MSEFPHVCVCSKIFFSQPYTERKEITFSKLHFIPKVWQIYGNFLEKLSISITFVPPPPFLPRDSVCQQNYNHHLPVIRLEVIQTIYLPIALLMKTYLEILIWGYLLEAMVLSCCNCNCGYVTTLLFLVYVTINCYHYNIKWPIRFLNFMNSIFLSLRGRS